MNIVYDYIVKRHLIPTQAVIFTKNPARLSWMVAKKR